MSQTTAFAGLSLAPETAARAPRPGFLARVYAAILASRERRAEAEIARYIRNNGGTITDDIERRIATAMMRAN